MVQEIGRQEKVSNALTKRHLHAVGADQIDLRPSTSPTNRATSPIEGRVTDVQCQNPPN